jgi:hypothetical protein
MITTVFTWVGALLGIAVLLAMAFGAFVLDFHDVLTDRRARHRGEVAPDAGAHSCAS